MYTSNIFQIKVKNNVFTVKNKKILNIFLGVKGIQKIPRLPISWGWALLAQLKIAKYKSLKSALLNFVENYSFLYNFETKQDITKIPAELNSMKSDTSLV